MVVPIFRDDKIVAVLGVGNKATKYTNDDEKNLNQIAHLTWEIAHQKKTSKETALVNSKWQVTFDSLDQAIFILNKNGEIVQTNKKSFELFKSDNESLSSKNCHEILNCEIKNQDCCPHERAKYSRKRETQIIQNKNSWLEASYDPILNNMDEMIGGVYIINDITERIKTETALKDSELFNRKLFQESSMGLALADMDGNLIDVNPAYLKIIGYSLEEALQLKYWDYTPEQYLESEKEQIRILKETGKYGPFEKEYIHKDGHHVNVRLQGSIMEFKNTKYSWSSIEDISSTNKYYSSQLVLIDIAKLSFQELSFHDFFQKVHLLIKKVIRAENFYVVFYHEDTETYTFQYHVDEIDSIILNKHYKLSKGYTDFIRKSGESKIFTSKNLGENKIQGYGEAPSVWLGVPLKDDKEATYGVLAIQDYNDLSAYTKVELNVMDLIARNIGVFIDRIKTLNELKEAKEKAVESDRLKSVFLANMSHEIRTPMNGILGFTELLKEPKLSGDEQKQFIEVIERNGNRLLLLISDLIDISKIEAGQMSLNINQFDIQKEVNSIYTFFEYEASDKGMDISILTPSKDPYILYSDKEKIAAVFINLIKNALKYSLAKEIIFGYELKKGSIEFFVKDDGIGIPIDKQKKIFERFVQADNSLSSAYEGAGLGLAISKAYIEMMDGKIWIDNKEDVGSHFRFSLPLIAHK